MIKLTFTELYIFIPLSWIEPDPAEGHERVGEAKTQRAFRR